MPTIGRDQELRLLEYNLAHGINTVLVGPDGVAKSHLLAAMRGERVVRVPELCSRHHALREIAQQLHAAGLPLTDPGPDWTRQRRRVPPPVGPVPSPEQLHRRHQRTSIEVLTRTVLAAVPRAKWTLVIDDVGHLTPTGGELLDQLATRFVTMTASERIRPKQRARFRAFDHFVVPPLSRYSTLDLVKLASAGAQVESVNAMAAQLAMYTAGNPGAVLAAVDYLRRSGPVITTEAVDDLPMGFHCAPQIDLTPFLALGAFALLAAREFAWGVGDTELYLVTGLGWAMYRSVRGFLPHARYHGW